MSEPSRDEAPAVAEWRRHMAEVQAEALAELGRWADPLAVPPPRERPPEHPASAAPEQDEAAKAALARDFPEWSVWYTGGQWYAAGPCPCTPDCSGRRTLHAETPVLLRAELRRAAARRARRSATDPGDRTQGAPS